jgi:hypothetical protein
MIVLGLVSVALFVGTLLLVPWLLIKLPPDYFDTRVPRPWMPHHSPAARTAGLIAKNVLGLIFLAAGVAMLVLPGQGILTLLLGVSLVDFPGKRRVEAWIVGKKLVLQGINALRTKFGKPPLSVAPR